MFFSFLDAHPVTPPALVRVAMLLAYLYTLYLGHFSIVAPSAPPAALAAASAATRLSVLMLTGTYIVDAFLAASPLNW
jgi:TRAP-type uncharacterized transport system fused permease subunit